MVLPLAGLHVLDLSNMLAGPFCGYQLGLLGTKAIKIEVPGNDDLAHRLGADPEQTCCKMDASFVAVNAGEQSVTASLKHPEGRAILLKLVAQTDALIESYRPGTMDRLGLGYDVLRKVNLRLVYCVISGFGKDGPLSDRPAYDQIIQGIPGVMSITGDDASTPLCMGYPISDTMSGITAALAVTACLLGTQRTGQGCMVNVSMLRSTLIAMGWIVSNYLNVGVTSHPMGNQSFTAAPFGAFRTGGGLINIVANEDRQFATLCRMAGHPELAADAHFVERHARKEHRRQLNDALKAALVTRSAAEWESLLIEAGVSAGLTLDVPGVLAHEQVAGRDFVITFSEAGQHVTRARFHLSGESPCLQIPAPVLSAHTDNWLTRLGCRHDQIEALCTEGAI